MLSFNTAEEMVAWMKSLDVDSDSATSSKKSSNMIYFGGQKIKKDQVWIDMMGWNYLVEDINSSIDAVTLKRQHDGYTFIETAGNLVSACKLIVDVKNRKKIPAIAA